MMALEGEWFDLDVRVLMRMGYQLVVMLVMRVCEEGGFW